MTPIHMAPDPTYHGVAKGLSGESSVWSSVGARSHDEGLGSLAEALDRILCKGVSVDGAVTIGVAGVELVLLDLRLLLAAIDTVRPEGSFFSAFPAAAQSPYPAPRQEAVRPIDLSAAPATRGAAGDATSVSNRISQPPPATSLDAQPSDREGPRNGLVRLVLTLVNLLHEVLERQAVRRMGNGTLTPAQIDDVGTALYAQAMEIARLRRQFGLSETDLTLRLSATG
jgi:hypothetical protein